ncbi:MAG: hypothetical protein ACJA1Z_000603 [Patiriisocius sp.]|jgi:hypothetical protein
MIFGISINSNSITLHALYQVFGIVSGIGTLFAVIIATSALSSWKKQFSHTERFKAFKDLEQVSFECIGAVERYWGVFKDENFSSNTPCYYQDHTKAKNQHLDAFWRAKEYYRVNVDFVQSLLSEAELKYFKYSYGHFDTKIHDILSRIFNSYDNLEGEERFQSLLKIEKSILDLRLGIKESLREYRGR